MTTEERVENVFNNKVELIQSIVRSNMPTQKEEKALYVFLARVCIDKLAGIEGLYSMSPMAKMIVDEWDSFIAHTMLENYQLDMFFTKLATYFAQCLSASKERAQYDSIANRVNV